MLELVTRLFDSLHSQGVRYCHWKSNRNLDKALNGEEDLDLLVARESIDGFNISLALLGFKKAIQPATEQSYSIYHYYGLDVESGKFVHLHLHYRLVTGGSILKNYRFPFEKNIFENLEQISGVYVPSKAIELLLLVVRKTLESVSITETFMLLREKHSVQKEIEWLLQDGDSVVYGENGAVSLFQLWFPDIDSEIFVKALDNLQGRWSVLALFALGYRMSNSMKQYTVHSKTVSLFLRGRYFSEKIFKRLVVKRRSQTPYAGGTIIAIVGPDATGKSTVVNMLSSWLAEHFCVQTVHAGRPPASLLTLLPNTIIPFLRVRLPRYRTGNIEAEVLEKGNSELQGIRLLVFIVRSLMIAYDRKRLLSQVFRQATKGCLVVCDRYPTPIVGAMDSVQVDMSLAALKKSRWLHFLADIERMMYLTMPRPDIVIQLTVPIETALQRNKSRDKAGVEDEAWVRRRHKQSKLQKYPETKTFLIDTSQDLEDTLRDVKHIVWSTL